MKTFNLDLTPTGPFSLSPLRTLACGFLRGTRVCSTAGPIRIAFPADARFVPIGAELTIEQSRLVARVSGDTDPIAVRAQLARVLALDHDGEAFARVVAADPALCAAMAARPGFRPVVAYSPYTMALWCVLTQRQSMAQAARIQIAMAEYFGDLAVVGGERIASFPQPKNLLSAPGFAGVSAEKWTRVQAVAAAALKGELEAKTLLALPYEVARQRLLRLRGIGDWSADAIVVRGCGTTDVLPLSEPTLHDAVQAAYALSEVPSDEVVTQIAERWRPFRTWVSVLLIAVHFTRRGTRSNRDPRRRHRGATTPDSARA